MRRRGGSVRGVQNRRRLKRAGAYCGQTIDDPALTNDFRDLLLEFCRCRFYGNRVQPFSTRIRGLTKD
jgi:hypothetical protein